MSIGVGALRAEHDRLAFVDRTERVLFELRTAGSAAPISREGSRIVRRGPLAVEELERLADGAVEQRWRYAEPVQGPLVVRVEVEGVGLVERDAQGLVLHSSRAVATRLRYSNGLWIDADGATHPVEARWDGDAIVLEVPEDVVARSRFPAVLDPRLEPIVGFEEPYAESVGGWPYYDVRMAGNARGYVVAVGGYADSTGRYSLPRTAFVPVDGERRGSWGVAVDPNRPAIGAHRTMDLAPEGDGFLLTWVAAPLEEGAPHVLRAQRLDAEGELLGAPFDLDRGGWGTWVALCSAPSSTVARWVRYPSDGSSWLCASRIPSGGAPRAPRCHPFALYHSSLERRGSTWMAATEGGWLAARHAEDGTLRALRFEESTDTFSELSIGPIPGVTAETPLHVWATDAGDYRVLVGRQLYAIDGTGPAPPASLRLELPACVYCGLAEVRSSTLFTYGPYLGRIGADGTWSTVGTLPREGTVVQAGARFAFDGGHMLARLGEGLAPLDDARESPFRTMSTQSGPRVAALPGRYAVAFTDVRLVEGRGGVVSTRVARLDAAGTVLDVTILPPTASAPVHVVPVGDRFVVVTADWERGGVRTFSLAARGDVDVEGPHALSTSGGGAFAVGEGSTALLALTAFGAPELVRVDDRGRPIARAARNVRGLCRTPDGTLALLRRSSDLSVALVDASLGLGAPRLVATTASVDSMAIAPLASRCAVLWRNADGLHGARVGVDGVELGPTRIGALPIERVASARPDELLFAQNDWLWTLDELLQGRGPFPLMPERGLLDRVATQAAGASAADGEHLVVWDWESPARSLGAWPVRLAARIVGRERPVGEPRVGGFECESGFCVEGRCCDAACDGGCETCVARDGAPADGRCTPRAAGTDCRDAVGVCDRAERCDGVSGACPTDAFVEDGSSCEDALVCNGAERCAAGACVAGPAPSCVPPSACWTAACVEPEGCVLEPVPGCCEGASDCDDGDADTLDECVEARCRSVPRGAPDAGAVDGGIARDAGAARRDAGAPTVVDAGMQPADAGVHRDAVTPPDAGARDGGVEPAGGSCGCRVGAREGRGSAVLGLLLVAAAWGRRARRRTRAS